MSRQLINEYRAELDKLRQVSGSRRESVVREPFKDLLKRWGKAQDLQFVAENAVVTAKGNRTYTNGALLHGLRVPFGYREANDEDDRLDDEMIRIGANVLAGLDGFGGYLYRSEQLMNIQPRDALT